MGVFLCVISVRERARGTFDGLHLIDSQHAQRLRRRARFGRLVVCECFGREHKIEALADGWCVGGEPAAHDALVGGRE